MGHSSHTLLFYFVFYFLFFLLCTRPLKRRGVHASHGCVSTSTARPDLLQSSHMTPPERGRPCLPPEAGFTTACATVCRHALAPTNAGRWGEQEGGAPFPGSSAQRQSQRPRQAAMAGQRRQGRGGGGAIIDGGWEGRCHRARAGCGRGGVRRGVS